MLSSADELRAVTMTAELDAHITGVEQRLAALHAALRDRQLDAIEAEAAELQRALGRTVERFVHAARNGGVPPALRTRLARASALVATQRESLARATAALDRAMDVLLPQRTGSAAVYSPAGSPDTAPSSGFLSA